MVLQTLAAIGLGVVASMHLLFVLTGLANPSPSLAISVLGFAGAVACAWGFLGIPRSPALAALAAGLFALLVARSFHFFRGFDGFGFEDVGGALSVSGLLAALVAATLWALSPDTGASRARGVRFGFALAAAGYFVTMVTVLSSAGLVVAFGLLLGSVGFSLAAPNVEPPAAEPAAAAKVGSSG